MTEPSMRAISLWQPWASLIALGAKTIETRSWRTNYRGEIAIAATLSVPKLWRASAEQLVRRRELTPYLDPRGFWPVGSVYLEELPKGAIVARAELVDCVRTDTWEGQDHINGRPLERLVGNFARGRWAWILEDIKGLAEPIPVRGGLGIWIVPEETAALVRSASTLP
jgi:activating signal cointegrator 1